MCFLTVNNDVNGELNEPGSACSGPWKLCQGKKMIFVRSKRYLKYNKLI